MAAPASTPLLSDGWFAGLELGFSRRDGGTVLSTNRHQGPLRLQRPLYPEPEVCHAVILHPPGGVVGGDRLEIRAAVEKDAAALITTPGATKFYRSGGAPAGQIHDLRVGAGGCLEWLPQETLFYPGADAGTATRVHLEGDAVFMGWEILCVGLPACGRPFDEGRIGTALAIDRDGRPVFRDRLRIDGPDDLHRPAGLRGCTVAATFLATGGTAEMLPRLRDRLAQRPDALTGVTLMDDLLAVRYIGRGSAEARTLFRGIWEWLRPRLCGRNPCAPRIWST